MRRALDVLMQSKCRYPHEPNMLQINRKDISKSAEVAYPATKLSASSLAVPLFLFFLHKPQRLPNLDLLPLLDIPLPPTYPLLIKPLIQAPPPPPLGRLKHHHNRAPQLKPTHLLSALQRKPAKQPASGLIARLRISHVRLARRLRALGRAICSSVCGQRVCAQLAVKVDADGADVCGADGGVGEEAVAPAAEQDDALVEGEEARQRALQVGRDGVELAGEVAARGHDPGGRRVEAVVVAWREVDDAVVERGGLGWLGGRG